MRIFLLCCIVTISVSSSAGADGDGPTCPRPTTTQEKEFYRQVHEKVKKALPTMPNWNVSDLSDAREAEYRDICPKDVRPMSFTIKFSLAVDQEIVRQAERDNYMTAYLGTPEQQARKTAFEQEEKELYHARKDAKRKGNYAEADRLSIMMDDVSKKGKALRKEIDDAYMAKVTSGELNREIARGVPKSSSVGVWVSVNSPHYAGIHLNDEAIPVEEGAPAFWSKGGYTPHIEILLGNWKGSVNDNFRSYKSTFNMAAPETKVQTFKVEILSDRETAEAFLKQFDLKSLQALTR
jgi:hypothetical protein